MKHLLFILAAAVSLQACMQSDSKVGGTAQNSASANNALTDSASFTAIQWTDSTFQDLGRIKKGAVVEISWHFKNAGNKPLIIQNVRPGCGCTVAEKPEEPIAPGGTGVITGKFDSNNQSEGEHRKSIAVEANTSGSVYHQLDFRVEVVK